MVALLTVLLALPLGFLLRSRLVANVSYALAYLWAFTFQTLYLLLDSLESADGAAFRPGELPLAYGLVTLTIFLLGFGLVSLGHRLGKRRRSSSVAPLPPAHSTSVP
jgi:hypothetical protein